MAEEIEAARDDGLAARREQAAAVRRASFTSKDKRVEELLAVHSPLRSPADSPLTGSPQSSKHGSPHSSKHGRQPTPAGRIIATDTLGTV